VAGGCRGRNEVERSETEWWEKWLGRAKRGGLEGDLVRWLMQAVVEMVAQNPHYSRYARV
jgi:hypothetical protein